MVAHFNSFEAIYLLAKVKFRFLFLTVYVYIWEVESIEWIQALRKAHVYQEDICYVIYNITKLFLTSGLPDVKFFVVGIPKVQYSQFLFTSRTKDCNSTIQLNAQRYTMQLLLYVRWLLYTVPHSYKRT